MGGFYYYGSGFMIFKYLVFPPVLFSDFSNAQSLKTLSDILENDGIEKLVAFVAIFLSQQ